jgi:PAS domain S-box-containing protein
MVGSHAVEVVFLVVAAVAAVLLVPAFLLGRRRADRVVAPVAADTGTTITRALRAAPRLAAFGVRADTRDQIFAQLAAEAGDALGGVPVRVVPGSAGNQPAVQRALALQALGEQPFLAVPLENRPPSALVAVTVHRGPQERLALEALAEAARGALASFESRNRSATATADSELVSAIARRLLAQDGLERVAAAMAGELREHVGAQAVGVAFEGERERWYPASPADEPTVVEQHPLTFGGSRLGVVALVASQPIAQRQSALAEHIVASGATALGVARLREQSEALGEAQAALLAVAEAVAAELDSERLLGRIVTALPSRLGVDGAVLWLTGRDRPEIEVAAVFGLPRTLLGAAFPADAGAAAQAVTRGVPAVHAHEEPGLNHGGLSSVRRELAVPVTFGSRGRGALSLVSFAAQPAFGTAAIELGAALGRLVSLALESAETVERRRRQARLERAASQIAADLAGERRPERVRGAIARVAQAAFGADGSLVRLGEEFGVAARAGGAPPFDALAVERLSARERRVVAAGDVAEDSRLSGHEREALGSRGALLCVPLARPGARGSLGVVTLVWNSPRTFADEELALSERLRQTAVAALERAELEEAERRANVMARELQRVGALIAADLDAQTVLRQIVAEAMALLGADACALLLLEGDRLIARAVHGEAADVLAARRLPADDPISTQVLASADPVAVPDLLGDGRLPSDDPLRAAGFAGFLGAPVQSADGDVRGVLAVYDRRERDWRSDEIDALAAFANSAAVALRNALLYERVAQEKAKGEAVLGQVADGIVAVDATGRVTMWNAAAEAITVLSARRALGRALGELLRSEFGDADGIALTTLREAQQQASPTEVRLVRGGREIWLSVAAAPLLEPGQERPGVVFAMRDVSAERMLDQLKSDFVATVSHELRTPLTSIYGFAETLLRADVQFGEDDRETFLRYIATEAERLTRLVEGLLSATRLEAGAVQLALEPVDLASASREVATWASGRSTQHKVDLVLPPEPLWVTADADRVKQILLNLVDNAIKYSPGGGSVTVRARRRGRVVEVRVQDEGIGISERDQRNLFRKFFRVDAEMSRGIRGIGLGLYLVRGFVAAMGGRIWVESEEAKGSTFIFELPVADHAPVAREGQTGQAA